jgi:hypothetical protein
VSEPRIYGPLAADHPSVLAATPCPTCGLPIRAGDFVQTLAGAPATPADAARAAAGRAYNTIAKLAHWQCGDPKAPTEISRQ